MFKIDPTEHVPIYLQIVGQVREMLERAGRLGLSTEDLRTLLIQKTDTGAPGTG